MRDLAGWLVHFSGSLKKFRSKHLTNQEPVLFSGTCSQTQAIMHIITIPTQESAVIVH